MCIRDRDRDDELSLGMLGMHGSKEGNLAISNSDLLIAIGRCV